MRHRKRRCNLGHSTSHRRCLIANLLKSLIEHGRIETSVRKAKELRRHADRLITLAKGNTLANRRIVFSQLMIRYNSLTSREMRAVKGGDLSSYNSDRKVVGKLFGELSERFEGRNGGYTRIVRKGSRRGDAAPCCIIEYLAP